MSQDRRYRIAGPIIVAAALLTAFCAVATCSYLLVTGGRP